MGEMEKLLASAAQNWFQHACSDDECPMMDADCLAAYLKRRLLPLLEAGEEMRRFCEWESMRETWDAAKAKALEGL